jgi:hypothetical protein
MGINMATITQRKRANGTIAYKATVRKKHKVKVIFSETTFLNKRQLMLNGRSVSIPPFGGHLGLVYIYIRINKMKQCRINIVI